MSNTSWFPLLPLLRIKLSPFNWKLKRRCFTRWGKTKTRTNDSYKIGAKISIRETKGQVISYSQLPKRKSQRDFILKTHCLKILKKKVGWSAWCGQKLCSFGKTIKTYTMLDPGYLCMKVICKRSDLEKVLTNLCFNGYI